MDRAAPRRYARRLAPAARREQLLDVALSLVVESGYGALSMHAVARRAEVTRPVVYDSFASKDELISALVRREGARMRSSLTGLTPAPSGDPVRVLIDVFAAFLAAVRDHPNTWRLVYIPPEGTPQVLRDHIATGRARIRALLEPLLAALATDTDAEVAAHIAQGIAETAARLVLADTFPPERLVKYVTRLVTRP
jgi:AcrR family transcriptional regulator